MKDLKLDSLKIVAQIDDLPGQIKTENLKPIAENLVSNIQRVVASGYYSQLLSYWMFEMGQCVADSFHDETQLYVTDGTHQVSSDTRKTINKSVTRKLNERLEQMPPEDHMFPVFFKKRAISQLARIDAAIEGKFTLAAESILAGMITGSWTAIEVFTEDLWEASVNLYPDELIEKLSTSGIPDFPEFDGENQSGKQKSRKSSTIITMDVADLARFGFDLRGKFASFFKSHYRGRSYDGISKSYKLAFNRTFASLNTSSNRSLFNLAKTRNAIVHKAGTADKEFIRDMVSIDTPLLAFSNLSLNDKIILDGVIVSELVNEAIKSVVVLAVEIDAWVSERTGGAQ